MTAETVRVINSELPSQMAKKLDEIEIDLSSQLIHL